jgi:phospholipid/cholesterol/gamma-HCH transport system substrate-binding protein
MKKVKPADKETRNTILLGLFVALGLVLLIVGVYFIGSKKNFFRSTFHAVAAFKDVSGLQNGDAVRLRGITVGTVYSIKILNDSDIAVVIDFKKEMQPYIKKNAIVSITTDGLMGNKIVTIKNDTIPAQLIAENDTLHAIAPIDMEDVTRKLKISNDKMALVFTNLSEITDRINKGKGTLGTLITDTTFANDLKHGVRDLEKGANNIKSITKELRQGKGALGTLLNDTAVNAELKHGAKDLEEGASNIHTATEGLKHSFLFRRYFKKHHS